MAAKLETTVQPSVSMKPLDIYNEMSGHFPAVSVETEPHILSLYDYYDVEMMLTFVPTSCSDRLMKCIDPQETPCFTLSLIS